MTMDELDISGKRYISSKRAAKENRYHVDYIGQLIRAGKIIGSKVGRMWYVEVESLSAYLGLDHTPPTTTVVAQNYTALEVKKNVEPSVISEIERVTPTPPTYSSQSSETNPYTLRVSKIPSFQEHPTLATVKASMGGLTYLSDDEPLLPQVRSLEHKIEIHKRTESVPQESAILKTKVKKETTPYQLPSSLLKTQRGVYTRNTNKALLYVAGVMGFISFVGSIAVSYYLQYSTVVEAAHVQSTLHF